MIKGLGAKLSPAPPPETMPMDDDDDDGDRELGCRVLLQLWHV